MKKINFGCGLNRLEGWENYDWEIDISKPLPFETESVDYVFAEHVVEHITHQQAYTFLEECARVLRFGGKGRIAIPGVEMIYHNWVPQHGELVMRHGFGKGTREDSVKQIVFLHGHQGCWTREMMRIFLQCIGFSNIQDQTIGNSTDPNLRNLEGHGKIIGEDMNRIETIILEFTK